MVGTKTVGVGEEMSLLTDSWEESFKREEESSESLMVAFTNHIREKDEREIKRLLETDSLETALREDTRVETTTPSNNQVCTRVSNELNDISPYPLVHTCPPSEAWPCPPCLQGEPAEASPACPPCLPAAPVTPAAVPPAGDQTTPPAPPPACPPSWTNYSRCTSTPDRLPPSRTGTWKDGETSNNMTPTTQMVIMEKMATLLKKKMMK